LVALKVAEVRTARVTAPQADRNNGIRQEGRLHQDASLYVVFGIALMAVLRADSVAPALPDIGAALRRSSESVGLLITVFALPSVFLTPVLGILADRWGRKRILVPSLVLLGLAGSACSLARSFDVLLILRFVQGVGAASLSMLNITLIADLYSGRQRTTAMGYNAAVRSIGSTLFPILGGALAMLGWRYPFALSLLAIPVGVLVLFGLENPKPRNAQNLAPYLGQAWRSLKDRRAVGVSLSGCVVFVTMFGAYLAYFPFLLVGAFGASPLVIGLMVSGRSIVNALIASQLGRLTRICTESTLLKAAFVLYALAFVMIPSVPSLSVMAIVTILLGTAEGLYWPSNQSLLGSLAPMEHRAIFMSINDMILKVGQTLGPLLMGLMVSMHEARGAFYAAAGLSLAAFALTALLVRPPALPSEADDTWRGAA